MSTRMKASKEMSEVWGHGHYLMAHKQQQIAQNPRGDASDSSKNAIWPELP